MKFVGEYLDMNTKELRNAVCPSLTVVGDLNAGAFIGDGSDLTGISTLTGNILYVDAVNGNDGAAVSERLGKPFLTLAAAKASATSGDLIWVYPGSYTITASLAKHGVNWNFEAGTTVTRTDSGSGGIWDDGGAAMTFSVTGSGTFLRVLNRDVTSGVISAVNCTHADSDIFVKGHRFQLIDEVGSGDPGYSDEPNLGTVRCMNGRLIVISETDIDVQTATQEDGSSAVFWGNGELRVDAEDITSSTSPYATCIWSIVDDTPTGDAIINVRKITSTSYGGIYTGGSNGNAALWVNADIIKRIYPGDEEDDGGLIMAIQGDEKVYVTTQKIFGKILVDTNSPFYVNSMKIQAVAETGGDSSLLYIRNGTARIDIKHWDANGFTGPAIISYGGEVFIEGTDLVSDTAAQGILMYEGIVHVKGLLIDVSGNPNANAIDSATDGGNVPTGTIKVNDCELKSASGHYDIRQAGTVVAEVTGGHGSNVDGTFVTTGTITYLPAVGGGGGTGANPSATIGLAAVNGSASTFLRSDGAPALSQAITPTWTGQHIFLQPTLTTTGLIAKQSGPGVGNLQEWQLDDGTVVASMDSGGDFFVNELDTGYIGDTAQTNYLYSALDATHGFAALAFDDAVVQFTVRGNSATQTANLQEWQANTGAVLASVDVDGTITAPAFIGDGSGLTGISGGGTPANPTASVGLTAVNGSATTFLRSDGAPALSQAIVPTWTGQHVFNSASPTVIRQNGGTIGTNELQISHDGTNANFYNPTSVGHYATYQLLGGGGHGLGIAVKDNGGPCLLYSLDNSGSLVFGNNSQNQLQVDGTNGAVGIRGDQQFGWTSGAVGGTTPLDTALARHSAATVKITDGAGTLGTLITGQMLTGLISDTSYNRSHLSMDFDSTHAALLFGDQPDRVVFSVKGAASQGAHLQEWQNIGGSVLSYIGSGGDLFVGSNISTASSVIASHGVLGEYFADGGNVVAYCLTDTDSTHAWTLTNRTTTKVPFSVQGVALQSANLQEWQNSGGAVLASLSAAGGLAAGVVPNRQSLSGTLTLTSTSNGKYQYLNPNGSDRDITLWATPGAGNSIFVKNIGSANVLNIKDNGGTLLKALAITEVVVLIFDGTEWQES